MGRGAAAYGQLGRQHIHHRRQVHWDMEFRVHRDGEEWSGQAGLGLDKLVAQARVLPAFEACTNQGGEALVRRAFPWLEFAVPVDEAGLKYPAVAERWGEQWADQPMAV